MRSSDGSVSVYFIAATAGILLLGALLIDFSRIAAFRYSASLSLHAGVRSVLSSYDSMFYERFGLFIRGGEDGSDVLRTTLEADSGSRNRGGSFPYLDVEWSDVGVTESRPLADHDVLRRQVMEEMKIKAPVDLALELANRFRGVKPAVKEAAATVDLLERMQHAYDRRETALDRALAAQIEAGEDAIKRLRDLIPYPSNGESGGSSAGTAVHLAYAASAYADYVSARQTLQQLQELMARQAAESGGGPVPPVMIPPYLVIAVSRYEADVGTLSRALSQAGSSVSAGIGEKTAAAVGALREARDANEEMKAIMAEAASSSPGREAEGGAEADPSGGSGGEVGSSQIGMLAEIRQSAVQLIREDAFFDDFEAELSALSTAGGELGREASDAGAFLLSVPGSSGLEGALKERAARLRDKLADFAEAYGEHGSVVRNRRSAIEQMRSRDDERKALERESDQEWSQWTQLSGKLEDGQATQEARESFDHAAQLARANLEWNRKEGAVPEERIDRTLPSRSASGSMRRANDWLNGLADAADGLREALYFSEYAYLRFSRVDPADVRRMLEGKAEAPPLDRQEAEYILYGFAHPQGNIAAAYGEIFAFRLAIRTMEGLIESRGMGNPLVVLAAGIVYGIRHAIQDVRDLLEKDSVPLSKYMKVQTSYSDYLRLFYLLHGDAPPLLSRMIAVMEQETGLKLSEAYTYTEAEGTASLRLWFMPGLMKVLGRTGQLGGSVRGNRYEAEFASDSSYQ
jgi:hypothetical protein